MLVFVTDVANVMIRYYTDNLETWQWIQNWKNNDWNACYNGNFRRSFRKCCDGTACTRGTGTGGLIRFGTYALRYFNNSFRDNFFGICCSLFMSR